MDGRVQLQEALPPSLMEERLEARYGDPDAAGALQGMPWNTVLDTLLAHRSVRAYSDRPLPPGTLETIVAAAQSAPTSSNLQAWSVIAVEDRGRKARLASFAGNQKHVANAPLLLVFLADLTRLRAVSRQHGLPGEGLDFLELFVIGVADAAFAAQNAVVALESLGMGSCYIGAMRNQPEAVAAELGLPDGTFAVFGLTVGYPDPAVQTDVKPRLQQPVVLHHERYGATAAPEALAAYDTRVNAFQKKQHMTEIAWTQQAARRVRGVESLTGRDRLRAILQARGFPLR